MKTKKKFVKTLFINRAKWGFGVNGGKLLNKNGKMCCLGFAAKKCSYTDEEILNIGMPSELKSKGKLSVFNGVDTSDSKIAWNLATINDSETGRYKNPQKKEKRIKEIFSKIGTKVIFTGEFPENDK